MSFDTNKRVAIGLSSFSKKKKNISKFFCSGSVEGQFIMEKIMEERNWVIGEPLTVEETLFIYFHNSKHHW